MIQQQGLSTAKPFQSPYRPTQGLSMDREELRHARHLQPDLRPARYNPPLAPIRRHSLGCSAALQRRRWIRTRILRIDFRPNRREKTLSDNEKKAVDGTPILTEAELEARVRQALERVFPHLREQLGGTIQHQLTFSVRLGHHVHEVDSRTQARTARGRLDILVTWNGKPWGVLELKAPSVPLDKDDERQGLSYARLVEPPAPLVVITNGDETRVLQVWDGSPLQDDANGAASHLEALLKRMAQAAAHDRDEAVKALLGGPTGLWADVLREFSFQALRNQSAPGPHTPVEVPRPKLAQAVIGAVKVSSLTVLTGPPLSGKTTLLRQIAESSALHNIVPLYVDGAHEGGASPIEVLSAVLAKALFTSFSREELLPWLLQNIQPGDKRRLLFMVDRMPVEDRAGHLRDLQILRAAGNTAASSVLLAVEDAVWQQLSIQAGRAAPSALAMDARVLATPPLTDDEFDVARDLARKRGIEFTPGAERNAEFRLPRILALTLASAHPGEPPPPGVLHLISAVRGPEVLEMAWSTYARPDPGLVEDYRTLARAFLIDLQRGAPQSIRDSLRRFFAGGFGAIRTETAAAQLGEDRIHRMMRTGHLVRVVGPSDSTYFLPRVPELVAAAAARELREQLLTHLEQGKAEEAYELVKSSVAMPMGDIVAADSLLLAFEEDHELVFQELFLRLLNDVPEEEGSPLNEGDRIAILTRRGVLDISVTKEMANDGRFVPNAHAFIVAAHVLSALIQTSQFNPQALADILEHLAGYPNVLRRPEDVFEQVRPLSVHKIANVGDVVCHKEGIVEPPTQLLIHALYEAPEAVRLLIPKLGSDRAQLPLVTRLSAAAGIVINSSDSEAAALAKEVRAKLMPHAAQDSDKE
ncbi:hypothetical protein D7Y27_25935 [Corallococcus sp. AB004]|nr:hypothetical protein D7Y27_25935 [Corallococcus sp. AB004]